jgi:broad specificity phosphatase PhoE
MFDTESVGSTRAAPTVVYLARHGETLWNLERRYQGHRDSPLSERGAEQARRLRQRLASAALSAVYSSDLGRSARTAEIVAAPHGHLVQTHPGLREIDTGEWTGQARADVLGVPEWAPMVEVYRTRPAEHRMPGGESLADVQARGLAALVEIAKRHAGQSIAVITHHVVVETLLAHALGLSLAQLWLPQRGGNCFLSVLERRDGPFRPLVVLDGSHIGDLAGFDGAKSESKEIA